jgi:hypothetical protein
MEEKVAMAGSRGMMVAAGAGAGVGEVVVAAGTIMEVNRICLASISPHLVRTLGHP